MTGQWPPGGGDLSSEAGLFESDSWVHLAFVIGEQYLLYVDGSLVAELAAEVYDGPDPTGWLLGTRIFPENAEYYFIGLVDELGVYNRALSEDEINQNMNAGGFAAVRPANSLARTWGEIKVSR